jgi:formylglycine-generating enzyme required for sulfatase activity
MKLLPAGCGCARFFSGAMVLSLLLGPGAATAQTAKSAKAEDAKKDAPASETKAVAVALPVRVEGLRIKNVSVAPRDEKTATVKFDIVWPNSWRHGVFHDAAWVFFKVRSNEESAWQHVRLAADRVLNPAGYGQAKEGTPLEFVVPDGKDGLTGMFVRRAQDGIGLVETREVTAVVEWGTNIQHSTSNTQPATPETLKPETRNLKPEIRAFGVEMVYIPEGPFYVGRGSEEPFPTSSYGGGGMEQNWLYRYSRRDGRDFITRFQYSANPVSDSWVTTSPQQRIPAYLVTGAGPIPTGKQVGCLWAVGIKPADKGEIPAAFPNGYAAFYCMKYPWITQGQYADFLNTLTAAQAKIRYVPHGHGDVEGGGAAVKRAGKSPKYTYSATDPDGRCPFVSWADGTAYAAWAGLRPMTELEFEKAIRGPELAVPNQATPSYWGVDWVQSYELIERAVSIGDPVGRAFAGTHGSGTPDLPADWPSSFWEGVIIRGDAIRKTVAYASGGTWLPVHMLIAGRVSPLYASFDRSNGNPYAGWRGARSAPAPTGTTLEGKDPGDTTMTPFIKRSADETIPLARMKKPMQADGVLDEWDKPLLTLNEPSTIYPVHFRSYSLFCSDPWRGVEDMSVKAYLGRDSEALCVAAEVTDDVHGNTNTAASLWDGDAMNVGLIDTNGMQTSLWLALTTNGVVFVQQEGKSKNLSKTAKYAVVRDETAKVTRYELRLPLADLGRPPGRKWCYYFMFMDNDGKGLRYRFQWAPVITKPFIAGFYSKVVMDE